MGVVFFWAQMGVMVMREEEEERRMRMMRREGEENYSSEGPLASCCLIMRLIEMRTTFDRRAVFAG